MYAGRAGAPNFSRRNCGSYRRRILPLLCQHAAQALGARFAFVAETLSEMESRSLAFWRAGFWCWVYLPIPWHPLSACCCGSCMRQPGLRKKFAEDLWLQQIGADSYVAYR